MPPRSIVEIQEEIQDVFERLEKEVDTLTPETWSGFSETLIDKGLEILDDEHKNALLAFRDEMVLLEMSQDVVHQKVGDDGDDSLACKNTEEQDVEAAKLLVCKCHLRRKRKAIFTRLCIYTFILGVSGTLLYQFEGTSVADICKKVVKLSLTEALKAIPEAVDELCS